VPSRLRRSAPLNGSNPKLQLPAVSTPAAEREHYINMMIRFLFDACSRYASSLFHGQVPTRPGAAARPLALTFLLLTVAVVAEAEAPGKVRRVAVLIGGLARSEAPVLALEKRLAELGYVEGRNLVIDFRTAEGQMDRLPALAAELVGRRPDVLVAASTQAGMVAKSATQTIPIVLAAVGDPLATGIVPSLGRPGGNITGVSLLNTEMSGKGLQILKEAVPTASRVAVLWNSENRLHRQVRADTEAAAATLKVRLELLDVRGPDDLPTVFDAITRQRVDALLVLPDTVALTHRTRIVDFAAARRLPALYPFREMVVDGGFMCYSPNLVESFRAAAGYVDKILRGAKAGDLPIAQATKFDMVINLKTAKTLGLTLPRSLLLRADEVIE
jgi:putative ABC transport system substrate-binding protein